MRLKKNSISGDALKIIASSGRASIRKAVAGKVITPVEIHNELAKDHESDVRSTARKLVKKVSPRTSTPSPSDAELPSDGEEHTISIKTEPAGLISFGALDSAQISQLFDSITTQALCSDLAELRDNSAGLLNECDGVVNSGDEGDFGNEGNIVFSDDQAAIGPEVDDEEGNFKDGVYVVSMALCKCSVEFDFMAKNGFDVDEFEEISVPVRLPYEVSHNRYGHPNFNVITGFRFRGENIDEYEGDVADRGYDVQYTFFAIKNGQALVLYSNNNGDEEWCDTEKAKAVLSSFL